MITLGVRIFWVGLDGFVRLRDVQVCQKGQNDPCFAVAKDAAKLCHAVVAVLALRYMACINLRFRFRMNLRFRFSTWTLFRFERSMFVFFQLGPGMGCMP